MRSVHRIIKIAIITSAFLIISSGQQFIGHRRSRHPCPAKCLCLLGHSTVRCMHSDLTRIPRTPPETSTLDLRFNHIREISANDFRGLSRLHTLLLNNNQIKKLPRNIFSNLPALRNLYLYKNRIDNIHPTAFSGANSLEQLFLHNNHIKILPEGIFEDLQSLKRLRLDNNQLLCDCKMQWFAKMLMTIDGTIQATATCRYPRPLFGRSLSNVPLSEFRCDPPVITTQPESTQIRSGEPLYLSCTVTGSPQPVITWFKDGVQISKNPSRRINRGGSLIIINPKKTDEGLYKCNATNVVGTAESDEAQIVYSDSTASPPVFIKRPRDTKVSSDRAVDLICIVAGTPEPTIRWLKDGTEISPDNRLVITDSGSLHFSGASLHDAGEYTCVASNSEGEVRETITLTVNGAPTFSEAPDDMFALQGESITFKCRPKGHPPPTVSWMKNHQPLPRDQRFLVMDSGDLLIRAVNSGDDAIYSCRIENSEAITVADARLTVRVPPNFIVRPQSQRVQQGNTVDFHCQASGIPQPQIVWTIKGRAIPNDGRHQLLASGTLRILRVVTGDAGLLRCESANSLGARTADVTLEVIPFHSIQFARTPTNMNVNSGSEVTIPCHVRQETNNLNPISITWTKDNVGIVSSDERYAVTPPPNADLTIHDVGQDDAGRYECIARSGSSSSRASMVLSVIMKSSTEEIVDKLFEILPPGCLEKGCSSSFDVVELTDEEIAEALRQLGVEAKKRRKRQSGTSFEELRNSIGVVSDNIDGAINNTIDHLNDRKHKQTASDLLALMRFPSTIHGVNMMRAAEVFEVSLQLIECCIKRGMSLQKFEISHNRPLQDSPSEVDVDFDTEVTSDKSSSDLPVIGTEIVAVVANLSGCSAHQKIPDCSSEICFHRKYRTADGTCNNLQHPMWGAALTPFHRLLKPIYENGFNAPVGWVHSKLYDGRTLPSARRVSLEVLMTRDSRPATDADFTHMTMQWGQFLDHDLDFTTMAPSIKRFSDGIACRDSCNHDAPCFPISVNSNDPRQRRFHHHATHHRQSTGAESSCMEFTRSSAVCGSGITSVFFSAVSRREQINQITSYIDGSNVYSSGDEEMKNLRDLTSDLGLLKEGQPLEPGQKALLPYNVYSDLDPDLAVIRPVAPIECRRGEGETAQERSVPCFLCGDLRCNEQVALTSMHTIWMREHNRIARKLKELNPGWNGNTIFHEARKIVGAEMQHITYSHWLPKILGPYMDRIGDYKMYDPNSPASIVNVFATAAYRFGHTMINPIMYRLNETWGVTSHGNLMLHQAFFAPYKIIHEGGIDPLIRGLIAKPMKARASDSNMNIELVERLFELAEEVALDLGALNIQRGRDHALPFYNDWREYCNLTRAESFDDLAEEITNPEVRQKLQSVYGSPNNIDPFVGMILEDVTSGSRLGPTLACILSEQFKRVRDNDRFWFENPGVFSPAQITELRQTSLAKIICENTDSIQSVPKDVFRNTPVSDFVPCSEIPRVDLRAWKECCDSCSNEEEDDGTTLSSHLRRQKRSAQQTRSNALKKTSNKRKGGRKQKHRQQEEITLNDRQKVFSELAWSKSLQAESNPKEILDISKTIIQESDDKVERIFKDIALDEFGHEITDVETENHVTNIDNESEKTGDDMVKLLQVIQALESKVNSLQDEVQRLGGKIDK